MEDIMKRASFLDVVKTVLFGFIGIRRKSDHERARIHPAQIVIAAIIFVALFIFTIRTIVHLVTS
jgi:hypothetical protein